MLVSECLQPPFPLTSWDLGVCAMKPPPWMCTMRPVESGQGVDLEKNMPGLGCGVCVCMWYRAYMLHVYQLSKHLQRRSWNKSVRSNEPKIELRFSRLIETWHNHINKGGKSLFYVFFELCIHVLVSLHVRFQLCPMGASFSQFPTLTSKCISNFL